MKEPTLTLGFIIFNDGYKVEIPWCNGHWRTAHDWVVKNKFYNLFLKVQGTNNIYDEEDFLINYIGAIKLYANNGNFYCYAPDINSVYKDYLCKYYQNLGYQIIGHTSFNDEKKSKVKKFNIPYNKTVVKNNNNQYIYNPFREGD